MMVDDPSVNLMLMTRVMMWVLVMVFGGQVRGATWPFDQRQLLLVKNEAKDFPDEVTAAQFMDTFVQKGRVRWVTQKGGVGQIIPLEVPRDFDWQSMQAVKNFGLKYKVDGIVYLEQNGVELNMRWYSTLDGLPLLIEKLALPAASNPTDAATRKQRLVAWLQGIWAKIPGEGYVLSRDMKRVNIEGASAVGLKAGDVLEIRRVQSVERHPLLKTMINVKTVMTGLVKVTKISEPVSEADITYESSIDPIQEGDRYLVKASTSVGAHAGESSTEESSTKEQNEGRNYIGLFGKEKDEPEGGAEESPEQNLYPKIIDLEGILSWASVSHVDTVSGTEYKLKKSAPGIEIRGRFYLTRNWIINGAWSSQFYKFSSSVPSAYGESSLSSGTNDLRFDLGYRFLFLEEEKYPAEITFHLGYRRYKMKMGRSTSDLAPSAKSYKGVEMVLGAAMPVMNEFGVFASASRTFGTTVSETPVSSGASNSSALWDFRLGGDYKFSNRSKVLAGLHTNNASSTFEGTGTRVQPSSETRLRSMGFFAGYGHSF